MFKSILTKTIYEKRWLLLFWSIGVCAMALLMTSFYHSFHAGGFEQALQSVPKQLQGLVGNLASLKTVGGYVAQEVFAQRIPLLTLIMSIILFTSLLAGDENEGTLQTLLAQPVTRRQVYLEKFIAGLVISLIVCSAAIAGVYCGLVLIHEHMSVLRLVQATIGEWLLTVLFGSIAFAVGAITGKRGLAGALTGLVTFGSFVLTSFASSVSSITMIEKFSPFHYYNHPATAEYGLQGSNILVMVFIITVFLVIALFIFQKRNIYQR
ncbi:MAG: hypothetical protein NVS1B7_1360 [Candidatus Saccharimonadales bacterium]